MHRRLWIAATLGLSALGEAVTVATRFGAGVSAREFNRTAPLLLQIHHMFWALPLGAAAWLLRGRPHVAGWLSAIAVACVLSDLVHHFVVLPLLTGETGWHWP